MSGRTGHETNRPAPRRHRGRHAAAGFELWLASSSPGADGASEEDAAVVDQVAAEFGCETEMWMGSANGHTAEGTGGSGICEGGH